MSEHRYEFDREMEASVHQVRVRLPRSAEGEERELADLVRDRGEGSTG